MFIGINTFLANLSKIELLSSLFTPIVSLYKFFEITGYKQATVNLAILPIEIFEISLAGDIDAKISQPASKILGLLVYEYYMKKLLESSFPLGEEE